MQKLLFLLLHHGINVLVFAPGSASQGSRRSLQHMQDFASKSLAGQKGSVRAPAPCGTLSKGCIVCALPLMMVLHTRRCVCFTLLLVRSVRTGGFRGAVSLCRAECALPLRVPPRSRMAGTLRHCRRRAP